VAIVFFAESKTILLANRFLTSVPNFRIPLLTCRGTCPPCPSRQRRRRSCQSRLSHPPCFCRRQFLGSRKLKERERKNICETHAQSVSDPKWCFSRLRPFPIILKSKSEQVAAASLSSRAHTQPPLCCCMLELLPNPLQTYPSGNQPTKRPTKARPAAASVSLALRPAYVRTGSRKGSRSLSKVSNYHGVLDRPVKD
jgi:hypothetical protein